MRKRIPCQRDLRSKDPEIYAVAMARCQNAAQDCPEAGRCQYDGECFNKLSHAEAVERLEQVEKELEQYKCKWSKLNSSHLHLLSSLKLAMSDAVQNKNQERVFAYRSCIAMLERAI